MTTVAGEMAANAAAAAASASGAAGSAVTALAAASSAVNALTYVATSATSFTPAAGSKAFTLAETGRGFVSTDPVVGKRRSDPGVRFSGSVTSYAGNVLTVNVTDVIGSGGPFTDWIISHAAFDGLPAATVAEIRAGTTLGKVMTPGAEYAALAEVTIADNPGGTIALDMATFINAHVDFTGSSNTRTLGNPSNMILCKAGHIRFTESASGGNSLSYGGYWKRRGGAAALALTALAENILEYEVITSTLILYDLLADPTT